MCSLQTARGVVECVECSKPRIVYSKLKLSERESITLTTALSEYDFTCGSALLPPNISLSNKVMLRANLACATPIEVPFYHSGDLCKRDLCVCCAAEEAPTDQELLPQYQCCTCVKSAGPNLSQKDTLFQDGASRKSPSKAFSNCRYAVRIGYRIEQIYRCLRIKALVVMFIFRRVYIFAC